jgi:hypothetical protein
MTLGHWILDERGEKPIPCDLMTWAKWFGKSKNRIVKQEWIDDSKVSTIFLGIDHNFDFEEDAPPVLWETMVFNGPMNNEMDRCSGNREQAEAMHMKMVERVKSLEGQKKAP